MLKNIFYVLFLMILTTLLSCTKEISTSNILHEDEEVINGIHVRWKSGMSPEMRQLIRDIVGDMVLVQGGIFTMGTNLAYDEDARSDEEPAHLVELSDYYICAHELNQYDVKLLVGSAPYGSFSEKRQYTWNEWEWILGQLSYWTGLPFYFPTEAQWEFAARGGNFSKGYKYPGSNDLSLVWSVLRDASNPSAPNELGLYNMADKYCEWCADTYAKYVDGVMQTDPCVFGGEEHVVRGGCYESKNTSKYWKSALTSLPSELVEDKRMCRSTSRYGSKYNFSFIGCRPVINLK